MHRLAARMNVKAKCLFTPLYNWWIVIESNFKHIIYIITTLLYNRFYYQTIFTCSTFNILFMHTILCHDQKRWQDTNVYTKYTHMWLSNEVWNIVFCVLVMMMTMTNTFMCGCCDSFHESFYMCCTWNVQINCKLSDVTINIYVYKL